MVAAIWQLRHHALQPVAVHQAVVSATVHTRTRLLLEVGSGADRDADGLAELELSRDSCADGDHDDAVVPRCRGADLPSSQHQSVLLRLSQQTLSAHAHCQALQGSGGLQAVKTPSSPSRHQVDAGPVSTLT